MCCVDARVLGEVKWESSRGILMDDRFAALTQHKITGSFYSLRKCINLTIKIYLAYVLLLFPSAFHFAPMIFFFRNYVLDKPSPLFSVKISVCIWCIWDPASSKSSTHAVLREEGGKQSISSFQILVFCNNYMERYHWPSVLPTATT